MQLWTKDPNTNLPSVSLTLLVLSVILTVCAGILQMLGKVQSVSVFPEMMYSFTALYLGRRLNISGKAFSSDQATDIQQKVTSVTGNPQ